MASENTQRKETQDRPIPEAAPPEPAGSTTSGEYHTVLVEHAADPRVAPPKAWKSDKPPGGKLPTTVEPPQVSKTS